MHVSPYRQVPRSANSLQIIGRVSRYSGALSSVVVRVCTTFWRLRRSAAACSDESLEKVYRSQEVYERCVASGSRCG